MIRTVKTNVVPDKKQVTDTENWAILDTLTLSVMCTIKMRLKMAALARLTPSITMQCNHVIGLHLA